MANSVLFPDLSKRDLAAQAERVMEASPEAYFEAMLGCRVNACFW